MSEPRALSIRAPWWWAILYAGKDIENRDWYTDYRGPILIHASKWWSLQQVDELMNDVRSIRQMMEAPPPKPGDWSYRDMRALGGYVVGRADLVDCVAESDSPWFFGHYGFVLRNVQPIEPYALKGRLGLFKATSTD